MRTTRVVVLALGVLAAAVLVVSLLHRHGGGAGGSGPAAHDPGASAEAGADAAHAAAVRRADPRLVHALGVLRGWDARRAEAWTGGDVAALRRLYRPGSVAGRHDVAMLRAWCRRGLAPEELSVQVLGARLLPAPTTGRLRLLVTDRTLVRADDVGPLPSDEPSTRLVVLGRGTDGSGEWRVAAVYARPAATTSATPRSAKR